jgi:hypothetical protein
MQQIGYKDDEDAARGDKEEEERSAEVFEERYG